MATCDHYKILRKLGTGGFADVFLAKNKETEQVLALKIIVKNSDFSSDFETFIQKEIDVMRELSHKHIINLIEASIKGVYKKKDGTTYNVWYLALELASGGDLFDYVAQTSRFSEDIARYFLHQIIAALDYMGQKGISHRDMKPDNLLLDSECNIKISDFGWATTKATNTTEAGTLQYMAPEIHIWEKYNGTWVDIFAVGVIMFILVAQHPPFVKPDPKDKHYNTICANRDDLFWKWHTKNKEGGIDFFSESFRSLISMMLSLDPIARPTIAEIQSHEWYNLPVPSNEEVKEEFKSRKDTINKNNLKIGEYMPTDKPNPDVFNDHRKHRGVGNNEDSDLPKVDLEVGEYIKEWTVVTSFFSSSSLEVLYDTLVLWANKLTSEYTISDEDYSVDIKINFKESKLDLTASILKVPDLELYWIEIIKNEGDKLQFNESYKKIKEFFGGHADSEIPQ